MKNIFSTIIFFSLIPIALINPIEAHEVKSEEQCNKIAKKWFNMTCAEAIDAGFLNFGE